MHSSPQLLIIDLEAKHVSWNIGNIRIESGLVLAPMTRVTDMPFRLLCRGLGAPLAYTEMVNVNAVCRGNKAARASFMTVPGDRPLGIQLLGTQPGKFLDAAVQAAGALGSAEGAFLDVNLDCPDEAVLAQGAGAALLRRPERVTAIIHTLARDQLLPVTAKMRLTSTDTAVAVKTARNIEAAGAAAIIVHARTVTQKNGGEARWDVIAAIKEAVSVPVVGNGGISSPRLLAEMLGTARCDAAMVGKAAIYNPGVFDRAGLGELQWHVIDDATRFAWLQSYCAYASNHNCIKRQRVLQRACDFFKSRLDAGAIGDLLAASRDVPTFLAAIEAWMRAGGRWQEP
jgi:tRNA-dihydrouridine synthase B